MSGLIDISISGWKNVSVDIGISGSIKTYLAGYMGE
jgi:hypothetical protein